jgi:hypothetical protein
VQGAYIDGLASVDGRHEQAVHERLSLGELRSELNMAVSVLQMRRLRRRFAAGCHPDRCAAGGNMRATKELQIANDLIDQAIARVQNESA